MNDSGGNMAMLGRRRGGAALVTSGNWETSQAENTTVLVFSETLQEIDDNCSLPMSMNKANRDCVGQR